MVCDGVLCKGEEDGVAEGTTVDVAISTGLIPMELGGMGVALGCAVLKPAPCAETDKTVGVTLGIGVLV